MPLGWLIRCDPAAGEFEVVPGVRCVQRENGDLQVVAAGDAARETPAFAATSTWHAPSRTLRLVRDATGQFPLFHARTGRKIVASPDLRALLAEPGVSREPDAIAVAEWIADASSEPERTLLRAVRRVPAGHALVCDPTGVRLERHWSPPEPGTFPAAHAGRFGDLLEQAIGSVRDRRAAVYLSGGVDSAAVTAAAAAALEEPPLALSVVFESASEERTQRRVAADLGLDQLFATAAPDEGFLERGLRRIESSIWPTPALWAPVFDGLSAQAIERGATVLLDGQGGDELLDPGIAAGRALRRRPVAFARWLRSESRYTASARSSLRAAMSPPGAPALPAWLAPDPTLRRALEDRRAPSPVDLAASHEADLLDPVAAAGREEAFTRSAEIGLEHRHPLWDTAVAGLLFGLDPGAFSARGLPKAPARTYLSRRVPSLTGPWPTPEYADTVLTGALTEAWRLAAGGFPLLEQLGVSPAVGDTAMFDPQEMLAMLRVERWMRSLGERGEERP